MEKIKAFLSLHKFTVFLIGVLALLLVLGIFGYQKFFSKPSSPIEEVDLPFDAEGPYAILYPRRDGNALVLNLKRTSSYDSITYELAYTSKSDETTVKGEKTTDEEGNPSGGSIDRGVVGTIDTKDKKGEYEQEILFGTCSKNVCKYDKGVENGTLTLHIKKGDKVYRMVTQWHLQKPDVALGSLTSGDGHLIYQTNASRQDLADVGFSIINDLTGVPKLPTGKQVLGKVYSMNVPIAKKLPNGVVNLELAEKPADDVKLAWYEPSQNKWTELDSKLESSKFTAKVNTAGIFAVLAPQK